MFWFRLHIVVSLLLDLFHLFCLTSNEKDLEILFLRQQLAVIRRRQKGDLPFQVWKSSCLLL
jgi:hypothetical protein